MKYTLFALGFAIGALWGHYAPISICLPSYGYTWSDGYGSDGCGMCPWHDSPEETKDRERKDKEERDSGHCGAEGKPERTDRPGVY